MGSFESYGNYLSPKDLQNPMYQNQLGSYQAEMARLDALRMEYMQSGFAYLGVPVPRETTTEDNLLVLLTGE